MLVPEQTVQADRTLQAPPYVTLLDRLSRKIHIRRVYVPWLLSAVIPTAYGPKPEVQSLKPGKAHSALY